MADSDKNILITPNRSQTAQPNIVFTGKGNVPITLKLLDDSNGTLSFEGSAGQLFSINNNLSTGTIFSVNDISGVPMIDVDASGIVRLAPLGGTTYSNTLYAVPRTVAGSGNSVTIRAADGLTSGAGGNILLLPGLQATTGGDGRLIVRQPGGTAGTNEVQMWHDGSQFHIKNFTAVADYGTSSAIILKSSNDYGVQIARVSATTVGIYPVGTNTIAIGSPSNQTVYAGWWYSNYATGAWEPNNSTYPINWTDIGFYRGSKQQLVVGNYSSGGGSLAYTANTPSALSASTNDLALGGSAFQRLSSSAAYNLTGIAPPSTGAHVDGRVIWLHNVGSFNITLKHSQTSTAGNQFINENGGDIVLGPNRIVQCTYDATSTKWRVHGEMYPYNFPTTDGTNGQVLTTNGSGTLSWSTASGLGGSGTTNYIVKFTGSTTAGNSIIYDNGTNVGIGTASPTTGLDVLNGLRVRQNAVNSSAALIEMSNRNGSWGMGLSWNGYYDGNWKRRTADYVGQIVQDSAGNFVFYTGGTSTADSIISFTEVVRITNAGLFGIGNNSPGAKLQIDTGAAGTKGLIVKAAATPTANIVEVQNSVGTNLVYVDPSGDLVVGALEATTFPSGATAPFHVTRPTTAVATAIPTWPTYEPETQTNARVVAHFCDGGNGGTATAGTGTTNIIYFGQYYTGRVVLMPFGAGGQTPADQNSGAGRDIMLLGGKSDNTAGKTGGRVFIQGGTGYAGAYGTNFGNVVFQANGGNVGIGTTSPSSTLDIRATSTNSAVGQLMITAPTSGDNRFTIGFHTSTGYGFLNAYQNSVGGYPIILQQYYDARVGIGNITSPGAKLEIVSGTNTTKGLIVKGAASQSATLQEWQNSGGTALASVGSDGSFSSSGAGYFAGKLTGTITFNLMRDGYVYGSSSRICAAYYIPGTANSYLEMIKIVSSEPLILKLRTYADGQKQQREYNWIYTGNSSPTGILKPTAEYDGGGSEKYVIEFVKAASFDFRIRVRRTAGSAGTFSVYGVLEVVSRYGADYYMTDISGTGTSSVSNYLSDQLCNIAPSTIRSAPPVLGSGAGENLTIQASDGASTGAGGSIILQPGLQATSGGNGIVAVRQPGGTAGTDEIQLSHDGTKGSIINKDGALQLGGANIAIRNTANNAGTTVTATTLYATGIYSNNSQNADGVCNDTYSWAIDGSGPLWGYFFHLRVGWAHIKGYARAAGLKYTGNGGTARTLGFVLTDGGDTYNTPLNYRSSTTTISANTNNLTPGDYSAVQRLSPTANYNITGFMPYSSNCDSNWVHVDGRVMWFYNVGTYNLIIKHEDANSTAANRFTTETATDLIMPPNSMVRLTYDGATARWRVHTLSKAVNSSSTTTNISAATNNLALSGSNFQRLNCTTACNLTGVAPPSGSSTHYDGRTMRIYNVGTANLTLKHNSTSSDIANRFCCVQAVDIILAPRDYAELIYDGTDGGLVSGQNNPCWRVH